MQNNNDHRASRLADYQTQWKKMLLERSWGWPAKLHASPQPARSHHLCYTCDGGKWLCGHLEVNETHSLSGRSQGIGESHHNLHYKSLLHQWHWVQGSPLVVKVNHLIQQSRKLVTERVSMACIMETMVQQKWCPRVTLPCEVQHQCDEWPELHYVDFLRVHEKG